MRDTETEVWPTPAQGTDETSRVDTGDAARFHQKRRDVRARRSSRNDENQMGAAAIETLLTQTAPQVENTSIGPAPKCVQTVETGTAALSRYDLWRQHAKEKHKHYTFLTRLRRLAGSRLERVLLRTRRISLINFGRSTGTEGNFAVKVASSRRMKLDPANVLAA